MLTDHRCTKYTDCSSCSFYQRDIFKYRLYPKGYVIPQTTMHAEHGLFPSQGRDLAEQRGAPGHHVPGRTVRIATDRLESGVQGTRLHRMYHLSLRASAKHMRQSFQQRHLHRGERTPAAHRNDDGPADTTLHRGHEALPQR